MADNWKIEGSVSQDASPVQRKVRIYRRDTGALLGEVTSGSDGSFLINSLYDGLTSVVALDDDAGSDYNALIYDRVATVYAPTVDITDQALGKTATASGYQSAGYEPGKAVDGNSGTYWGLGGSAPGWWQVDLGGVKTITSIVWANNSSAYIYIGHMQGSDNGTDWTDLFAFNTTGKSTETYNGSWSARYIRWNCTSSSGGYEGWLSITALEVWGY